MTELSFLIELLLNHDLPKATKDLIASRIKEVEQNLTTTRAPFLSVQAPAMALSPTKLTQAPSTLAAMARHGDIPMVPPPEMPIVPEQVPVVLSGEEIQARHNSMEILKRRKQRL